MTKREKFYRSDKWERFREIVIAQRQNERGEIICAHCGKPITAAYDCVAHHKIELTDNNVDDYRISLNPELIELIHFKCHNREHNRFSGKFIQKVYLVYGSPCSGKSSWVESVALEDDLILDIDKIWDALCIAGRYKKQSGKYNNRVKANVFAVRDSILEQIKIRKGFWRNAYIIGGYPLRTERDRLCEMLRAEPIFINTPREECLKRCEAERPEAWKDYINNWFAEFVP